MKRIQQQNWDTKRLETNRKSEEKGEKIRRTREQKKQENKGTKWNIKSEQGSIQAEKWNRKAGEQLSKVGKQM